MAPSGIRKQTLRELREIFLKMTSAEWDIALEGKPEKTVAKAARELLRVQSARLRLGNAELANIRDKLVENEDALEKGRAQVSKAFLRLQKVKAVLDAVSSFVGVVARVVAPV